MTDYLGNPTSPADLCIDITPSDSTVIGRTKGIYVGVTGALAVTFATDPTGVSGNKHTFTNCIGGSIYPFAVTQVWSTGTSASDIKALY